MKTTKILSALMMILLAVFMIQCEKYGGRGGPDPAESDAKPWAGGGGNTTPHGNEDSGTMRGDDYGDLYVLRRDLNGVPDMVEINGEYYVQPVDEFDNLILRYSDEGDEADGLYETNDEELWGELVNPELAIGVEFGRLNIVRSPTSVLDNAYEESLKVLNAAGAVITLDFCGRLTSTYTDPVSEETIVKTIDSPRENMAIYRTIMKGEIPLFLNGHNPLMVAASCFAAGSDKTGTVNIDEVVYINGFMDIPGVVTDVQDATGNSYYDFTGFTYNRDVYKGRNLKIITLNGDGTYDVEVTSVWQAMEDRGLFTDAWPGEDVEFLTQVEGFSWAVDDAVQVLDFVHGDSNIEFQPN